LAPILLFILKIIYYYKKKGPKKIGPFNLI
jgi:hypothetical protein